MAYGLPIAHAVAGSTNTNNVTTAGVDTSTADLLIAMVSSYAGAAAPTLSDSKGNAWSLAVTGTDGGLCRIQIYYCRGGTVGAGHTATASGSGSYPAVEFTAWPGSGPSPLDQTANANGPGTGLQPGSITPSVDNCLVITAFSENVNGAGSSVSGGGGYTTLDIKAASSGNNIGLGSAYQIQTTKTATNPTWTEGAPSNCAAAIASFKAGSTSYTVTGPNAATTLPSNHNGNIVLTVTKTGGTFAGTETFSLGGGSPAGWAKVSQSVSNGASTATVTVSCPAAATPPLGATGTLTVSDGTLSATIPVATPTLGLGTTTGAVGTTPSETLTGANTLWQSETAAGLFTVAGGTGASIATPSVSSNTAATATLTVGTAAGSTLTVTDASTGAQATFLTTTAPLYLLVISDSKYDGNYAFGTSRTLADQLADVLARQRPSLGTVTLSNQSVGGDSIKDWSPAYTGTYGTHTKGVNYDNMIAAANAKPAGATGVVLFASMGSNDAVTPTGANDFIEIHQHIMTDLAATGKVDHFAIAWLSYRNDGGGSGSAVDLQIRAYNAGYDTLDGTPIGGIPVTVVDRKPYTDTLADPTNMLLSESGGTVQVHPTGLGGERWTAGIAAGLDRMLNPAAGGGGGLLTSSGMTGGVQRS